MAKSVIGADRNAVVVADLEDLAALRKRIEALEALMAAPSQQQHAEPQPGKGDPAAKD